MISTKPVLGVFSEIQRVSEISVLPHMSVEFPILELEILNPEVSMHSVSKHNPFERKPFSMLSLLGFQMFSTAYMQLQMLREIFSVVPCHSFAPADFAHCFRWTFDTLILPPILNIESLLSTMNKTKAIGGIGDVPF